LIEKAFESGICLALFCVTSTHELLDLLVAGFRQRVNQLRGLSRCQRTFNACSNIIINSPGCQESADSESSCSCSHHH
jgi:hypothetical protein